RSWFGACRPSSVALISASDVERRQPILPTTNPEFVGGCHLVRRIECAGRDFDFVGRATEDRRSANWAEIAPAIVGRRAGDADGIGRKHRKCSEYRAVMLTAVQAMANAHPKRFSSNFQADCSTEASPAILHVSHPSSIARCCSRMETTEKDNNVGECA